MEPMHPSTVQPVTPNPTPAAPLPEPPLYPRAAARPIRERVSLRRRAVLGAVGLAGVAALARLARAGELTPPPGPIKPTGAPLGEVSGKIDQTRADLNAKIDSEVAKLMAADARLDGKIAFTPQGIAEPRTPIASLPSSADAQFVITEPGAYCLTSNLTQVAGKVCIDIQADHVDIDGQGFVFLGGGGGGGGSSCIHASGRQAIEVYDCAFRGWQGACIDMADCDDVHLSDILFHGCAAAADPATGTVGALVRCRDRCFSEEIAFSSCSGRAVQYTASCTFTDGSVQDHAGEAVVCGDGSCIEECRFVRVSGSVIVAGAHCTLCQCDFRQCDGLVIDAGALCVVEGCDITGGSGGAIRCADGCCVEDCAIFGRDALAIECGSRCSVSSNHVVQCWGISCGSECACCDNDLSSCSGGPDAPGRVNGAITVKGDLTICEGNFIAGCRVGISVQAEGSGCHVHDNTVTGSGVSLDPTAGPGAGIMVHDAAAGVLCTSNHVRPVPGSAPYLLGTAAHGPIVPLASGDISSIAGSSHYQCNTTHF